MGSFLPFISWLRICYIYRAHVWAPTGPHSPGQGKLLLFIMPAIMIFSYIYIYIYIYHHHQIYNILSPVYTWDHKPGGYYLLLNNK